MPSRIDIGPDAGPFVELDEENGEFVIRVPEDEVNFDQSDLRNVKDFTAESVSTEQASINGPLDAESATVESLVDDRIYAGAFDGADADARLDNAITAATNGDNIYLENADYTSDRTISKELSFFGTISGGSATGTRISATWTLSAFVRLHQIGLRDITGDTIVIDSDLCIIEQCSGQPSATIQVNEDRFRYLGNSFTDVTFASETSGGIVDGCTQTTTTDNGTNTIGDIA